MSPYDTDATADVQRNETRQTNKRDPSDRFGHLFHLIGDAVIEFEIVSMEPIVRSVNPGFEEVFGYEREAVVGESLNEYIVPDGEQDGSTDFDRRTAEGKENFDIVRRETATGVREFLYRGVPYTREDGSSWGFAIYSDITEERKYERHMQVVHRLLRHNLRNDLSVVLGAANQIAELTDDEEVRELTRQIADRSTRLSTLSQETHTIEEVFLRDDGPRSINITHLCRQAATTVENQGHDGTVTVSAAAGLTASAIPQLQTAVEALVENALVHGYDEPLVHVTAEREDEQVILEVADNGPGIPETERAPIFDGESITQLQHGSGIGLWLVRWVVDAANGSLAYERTTDGWTVVRITLRACES